MRNLIADLRLRKDEYEKLAQTVLVPGCTRVVLRNDHRGDDDVGLGPGWGRRNPPLGISSSESSLPWDFCGGIANVHYQQAMEIGRGGRQVVFRFGLNNGWARWSLAIDCAGDSFKIAVVCWQVRIRIAA